MSCVARSQHRLPPSDSHPSAMVATFAVHGLRSAPVVVVASTDYVDGLDRTVS